MTNVRTAAFPESVEIAPGESGLVSVAITNTSTVINAYHVEVFGLDPDWVQTTPATISLFPGDTKNIDIKLCLPEDYPASDRMVSVNVVSADDNAFALTQIGLSVRPAADTSITLDPVLVTGGRSATFGIVVSNAGNTPVTATGFAVDPEDLAEFTFDPPSVTVLPGREQIIQVLATGGRAWFGQIRPRTFTFGVEAEKPVQTLGTFLQRPKISRWLISLLGLLAAAAVFAAVLSQTFGQVVEQAKVEDGVLDAALDPGEAGGAEIPANPSAVTGLINSSTGDGLSGVQAVLVDATDPAVPLSSASTDSTGKFAFSNLGTGNYLLQLSGAGIDTVWYQKGDDGDVVVTAEAADATPIFVGKDATVPLDPITVRGQPVVVAGTIDVADPSGVTVRLIVPGQIEEGTQAIVAEVELAPDGSFALPDVPTPGNYLLVVDKPGVGTQTQDITLKPGGGLPELNIAFNSGAGVISGAISGSFGPLDGALITATVGRTSFQTVSLSGPNADAGTFTLRNLPVPGLFTLTVERDGYAAQTRQVPLGVADDADDAAVNASIASVPVQLVPAIGQIEGAVQIADGSIPREVSVLLTGGEITRTIDVTSQGAPVGAYSFAGLPAPETYTLTFAGPGLKSQVRIVTTDPRAGQAAAAVDLVVMSPIDRTVSGVVTKQGIPVGQVTIVLSNGAISRTMQTSDDTPDPVGVFRFSKVPPGTYTLSASLPGSIQQVRLIDINASTPPVLDVQGFDLGQQASVTGTVDVFVERLDPPQRVEVQRSVVVRLFAPEQFPAGQVLAVVSTDPVTGSFVFPALEAETYIVAVYQSETTDSPLVSVIVSPKPGETKSVNTLEVTLR